MSEWSENMSMEEYSQNFDISTRAMNVCRLNRLITLDQLKEYFEEFGSFSTLRGCGDMVEKELSEIVKHYNPPPKPLEIVMTDQEETIFRQYKKLAPFKKDVFMNYILSLPLSGDLPHNGSLFSLSVVHPFLEKIIEHHTGFSNLDNVNQTIDEETHRQVDKLKDLINWLITIPGTPGGRKFIGLVFQNKQPLQLSDLKQLAGTVLDSQWKIKLFAFIDHLIYNETVFSTRERKIFQLAYTIQHDRSLATDILAAGQKLTTERIRQLKVALDADLDKHFSCITQLTLGDIKNYGFSDADNLIVIGNEQTEEMNQYEDVKFTQAFFTRIIWLLLERTHDRLFLNKNIRSKTKDSVLKNTYLVRREICRQLDFPRLFEDIQVRLNKKTLSEAIDVDTYLTSFMYTSRSKDLLMLRPLCEKILLLEFGLRVDANGVFTG